jgi:hypothetical protein
MGGIMPADKVVRIRPWLLGPDAAPTVTPTPHPPADDAR